MDNWKEHLNYDPLPSLLQIRNKAILYFVSRDLLEEKVDSIETLWKLPEVERILKKQQADGSWKYPGGKEHLRSQEDYDLIETYRQLGVLVEKYGFNNKHPAIKSATNFMLSHQTEEGDIRGIYGTQYSPNYTAAILELLIKARYENDARIEKGLEWLLSVRQCDGGWAIPMRTNNAKWKEVMNRQEILQLSRTKPFSHLVTGVVLRAFAAHPKYREKIEIKCAGKLLVSRFFENDKYPDRKNKDFWTKFSFPFWFTDLLSALDTLYLLGFKKDDPKIREGLDWFKLNQQENGLWDLKLLRAKDKDLKSWISIVICRTYKNFFQHQP